MREKERIYNTKIDKGFQELNIEHTFLSGLLGELQRFCVKKDKEKIKKYLKEISKTLVDFQDDVSSFKERLNSNE